MTKFLGITVARLYKEDIKALLDRHDCKDMLDYGCGSAVAYSKYHLHEYLDREISLYDPGIPAFSNLPPKVYDAVISIDVAEHVEETEVDAFFDNLFGYARKMVFLTICTRPAKKTLPDGRNAHVTLRPYEWWLEKVRERNTHNLYVYTRHTP